jgi:hypothetical protein
MNRRVYEQGDGQKMEREINMVYKKTGGAIRSYREYNTCYVFVNVRVNGIFKFVRTVKIRGFDSFREVN